MNYNPQLVLTLHQFGEQLRENGMDNLLYFTPGPEANRFVQQPNPFLIGVLFDQNIAAEMAWAAPYRLYQRLGHLDIERIAAMSAEGLSEIITCFPALHRYVRQMGVNLLALAQRLQVLVRWECKQHLERLSLRQDLGEPATGISRNWPKEGGNDRRAFGQMLYGPYPGLRKCGHSL